MRETSFTGDGGRRLVVVNYAPHPPVQAVNGQIIRLNRDAAEAGRGWVVTIDKGKDDGLDVVHAVLDVPEVREDQVDTRLLVFREQHTAVDDEQLALVLEDGHVATDLADAAESHHPQTLERGLRRGAEPSRRIDCGRSRVLTLVAAAATA